jgi:hypothetical protein
MSSRKSVLSSCLLAMMAGCSFTTPPIIRVEGISEPPGSHVWAKGQYLGEAPVFGEVSCTSERGENSVGFRFELAGYETKHEVVLCRCRGDAVVTVFLLPKEVAIAHSGDAPAPDSSSSASPELAEILAERPVVAVMDIQDNERVFDKSDNRSATEMLRGQFSASGQFVVIDTSRQEAKLRSLIDQRKRESHNPCVDDACQIPLGRALAADILIRSSISCLGDSCQFAIELIDLAKEAAVGGGTADFDQSPKDLGAAIKAVVRRIME